MIPVVGPQPSPTLDATMWNWEVFFNCFALLYKQFSMVRFGGSRFVHVASGAPLSHMGTYSVCTWGDTVGLSYSYEGLE